MIYDALLVGSTGQVGRYILRELVARGYSVAVVMRRATHAEAVRELHRIGVPYLQNHIAIVLGDALTCQLPSAGNVFNAAGCTDLSATISKHWSPNILMNLRLANHAVSIDATYHYLSTVSTALFRSTPLTEVDDPTPDIRQSTYTMTKAMSELMLSSVVPERLLRIYRISDVVPDVVRMMPDWRRDHWLSVLFRCGRYGFVLIPDDRVFYLATGSDIASAVVGLAYSTEKSGYRYHVIGRPYSVNYLSSFASSAFRSDTGQRLAERVTRLVYGGPEWVWPIDSTRTDGILAGLGFNYSSLGAPYWDAFSREAIRAFRASTPSGQISAASETR